MWNFTSGGENMHTRLNRIYSDMKKRCYDSNYKQFKDYGGRGIVICDEWLNKEIIRFKEYKGSASKGYLTFKKWALENGYQDNLTIDRIDVNGNYEPNNCRWVTQKIQNNNQRRNIIITYQNKTQTLKQWCEELGLNYSTVQTRISVYHWSVEKSFLKTNYKR